MPKWANSNLAQTGLGSMTGTGPFTLSDDRGIR
jgi:hypothetical protein